MRRWWIGSAGFGLVLAGASVAGFAQARNPMTGRPTNAPADVGDGRIETTRNPITAGATTAPAAQPMPNPLYTGWAAFKVGSWATYSVDMTGPGGQTMHGTGTSMLKSVTADAVAIESTLTLDGHDPMPATTATFPAQVEAAVVVPQAEADVAAAGRTFHCKAADVGQAAFGNNGPGGNRMTVYLSADVPGGIVKATVAKAFTGTLTLTGMDAK